MFADAALGGEWFPAGRSYSAKGSGHPLSTRTVVIQQELHGEVPVFRGREQRESIPAEMEATTFVMELN